MHRHSIAFWSGAGVFLAAMLLLMQSIGNE
jgi:hypothetical protein